MGKWSVHRCSTLRVSGEYAPVCAWVGKRKLAPAHTYEISVRGKHDKDGRCRPYYWSAAVEFRSSRFRVQSSHHSCKSVADATRRADEALIDEVWAEALASFYSHENIYCVAQEIGGKVVPFLSLFGHLGISDLHMKHWRKTGLIPPGVYYSVRKGHRGLSWRMTDAGRFGWTSRGTEVRFDHWLKGSEDD